MTTITESEYREQRRESFQRLRGLVIDDKLAIANGFPPAHEMAGLRPGYLMAMYNLVRRAAEPRLATVDDLYILGRLESVSERLHDLARERKQIMDALREFQNMIEYIDRVREGRRGR